VVIAAVSLWGCTASMAFRRGEEATRRSDPDAAVVHYREALQADPDRPEFKIALERAMLQASQVHFTAAKLAEEKGDLDVALREYRRASEYDPTNRQVAAKVADLDRTIRDRIEASRPVPPVQQMRERARGQDPVLNPASKDPLDIRFTNASVRDILNFVGSTTGINIAFSSDYRDPPAYTVQLAGVTLEEALQQVLSANNLFYKILNSRTIMVIPDNAQNRAKHEEQVVRTFFLSHADATEVAQLLNTVLRVPGVAVIPTIAPNKTRNTITVRGTAAMVSIMERVVEANDRPSAEVLLDVSIMEVNRTRAKQYGIDLGAYSITGIFSPEVAPSIATGGGVSVPLFNANTISAGISAADFYLTLPTAIARFLESDTRTKLVAKPQLRGQEGQKITLNLGDEIPVPQTTFGSLGGAGSVGTVPVSSFNYKNVGVNVIMTPRVTFDGDIVLELSVESSTLGADIDIAGQNLPSFGSRKIETKIRLRDGESTLLAGLLREDERRFRRGPLGLMNLPVFRSLFSHNDTSLGQTDIVMLITPHVVRTHELRQQDVNPIHIGTQQNLGLGGAPPLIAPQPAGVAAEPQPPGPLASPRPTQQAPRPITGTSQPGPVPGTMPAPGVVPPQPQAPPTQPPAAEPVPPLPEQAAVPQPQAGQPGAQAPSSPPAPQADAGSGRVIITPPGSELNLTGGPYTVPVSLSNAPRVSAVSVSVVFDPSLVRVRSVQEGSFMRQGGVTATFTREIDNNAGRVDISFARGQDPVGASGTGLLAALQVEPLAAGSVTFTVSGAGSGPAGSAVTLASTPVTVTVR
jgi:type II secretory pathway component GspD/PulD (secretin)